jgi:hypothetical protein
VGHDARHAVHVRRLIDRHATTPEHAAGIKANRIYQTLSSTLSGTQEYMAMEKLHELHDAGDWDLLVIDTPPTRNALDFLDAPKRMTSFLEGRLLRLLLKPALSAGKGYLKFVGAGATAFMKVAGKVTGMDLLNDLADFFRNFEGMYEGSRSAPTRSSTCCSSRRPSSWSSPPRSRRRCARPASSSTGSSRRGPRHASPPSRTWRSWTNRGSRTPAGPKRGPVRPQDHRAGGGPVAALGRPRSGGTGRGRHGVDRTDGQRRHRRLT